MVIFEAVNLGILGLAAGIAVSLRAGAGGAILPGPAHDANGAEELPHGQRRPLDPRGVAQPDLRRPAAVRRADAEHASFRLDPRRGATRGRSDMLTLVLFDLYGTHVIGRLVVGGRLRPKIRRLLIRFRAEVHPPADGEPLKLGLGIRRWRYVQDPD